jgi:hypothetical protein
MPEDPAPADQPDWDTSAYDPAQAVDAGSYGAMPPPPPSAVPNSSPGLTYDSAPAPGAHPYHLTPAFDPEPEPVPEQRFDLRFTVLADDAYDTNVATRVFIRWFIGVAAALAVVFLVIAWLLGTLNGWTIGACVLLVIGAVLLAPLTRWFVRNQYRGLEGQRSKVTVDEWGLHYESTLGRQEVPWDGLTDVVEAGRVFVFQYGNLPVAYLPRSAFVSVAHEEDVIAFARDHIDAAGPQTQGAGSQAR